jgi:HPr Serine kinase C-terminal domain
MSTETYNYRVYDILLQSDIVIPEMAPVEADTAKAETALPVHISLAPVNTPPEDATQLGPFLWASNQQLWLFVPKVAKFHITKGERICVEPESGVDLDSVRLFLLGSALGALLFQRNLLVMHGNAVRVGNQCVICVGRSGIGKSTLAAKLMQRGYPVLADDVVPIDIEGFALAGVPRIKLWQDSAAQLKVNTKKLNRIRPGIEKFQVPLNGQYCSDKVPVRWIYILNTERRRDGIEIEPITGFQRFNPLRRNTYRLQYLEGMKLQADHLKLVGKLASRVHLARVVRPEGEFLLDELADKILADIAANG